MSAAGALDLVSAGSAFWLRLLVEETVYSLLLAAVFLGLLRLLRLRSAALHEAAWMLVLMRLVVPPGWAAPFSLRTAAEWALVRWLPSAAIPHASISMGAGLIGPISPTAGASLWVVCLALVWALGAGALGLLMAARFRRYRGIAKRGALVADPRLSDLVARWRRSFRIRRPVRLVSSEAYLSPFTTGLFRPVIYLPAALLDWPGSMLEPVIAHELAHVKRWDELWILAAGALRAVYYFNPAAWLAAHCLARSREQLCDAAVLCEGSVSPRDYGRSLMEVLQLNLFGTGAMDALAGLVKDKEVMKMRLLSILSEKRPQQPRPLSFASATLAVALIVLPMAALQGPSEAGSTQLNALSSREGQAAAQKIYPMGDKRLVTPKLVTQVNPVYPEKAQKAGTQGKVLVEVVISNTGVVTDARVVKEEPAGHGFGEASVAAVKQWRYEPATLKGRPVAVKWLVTINFRLG